MHFWSTKASCVGTTCLPFGTNQNSVSYDAKFLIVHTPPSSIKVKALEARRVNTQDGSHADMSAPTDSSCQWGVYVFMSMHTHRGTSTISATSFQGFFCSLMSLWTLWNQSLKLFRYLSVCTLVVCLQVEVLCFVLHATPLSKGHFALVELIEF